MDDSDDYFDDLVLDEGTIAALDQVESQFAASQAFIPAPNRSPPRAVTKRPEERPAKRQKTEHTPLVPLKRELSANDYDDFPEISIQGDSYYQVGAPQASQRGGVVYRPSDTQGRTSRPLQTRTSSTSSITRGNVPRPSQQLSRRSTGPASHAANVQPVSNPPRGLQRMSSTQQLYGPPSVPRATQSMSTDQKARRDAEILRVKLEELEKNQAELQRKLQEAEDVRYTKEGEINILRANITRTNDQHAAEVARLQAAREAAEAAKLQLQREQKEELERLKTHYTFRQHELETSTRKAPWSVSKKALRLEPNTPVKMPSQMRNWNTGNVPDFGSTQTPRRPRFGAIEKSLSQRPRQPAPFAEPTKKKPTLPGFHNSFFDTPSRPSSQRAADKGKGKQRAGSVNDNPFFTGHARSSPPSSPLAAHHEPLPDDTMDLIPAGPSNQSSPSSRSPPPVVVVDESGDADMKIVDENEPQDEIEDMDPPNWRDELHHIVFTHALPPDKTPTMQTLLNASLSSNATPEQRAKYSSACSHLLETLGSMTLPIIWEDHLHEITKVFADLARILTDNATIYPLSSLFSLLRILSYTIPSFSAALLTPSPNDTPPAILLILCDTICSYVAVSDMEGPREMHDVLAKESLLFVEALALTAPEELIPQLSTFIRSPQVLPVLLDKAQPTWLLTQTARTLGILASFGNLFRTFISLTLPVAGQDDASAKDTTQVWHIEQLCLYLTDATREGPEADQLRDHILTFLAILALSHPDVLVVLLRSHTLIPSIIMYLSNETEPFWEDDAALISSPPKLNRILRIISRTIALLYYMVFSSPEPYRLNHKLHYTHHRQFYGIGHIFNVTMGRLSFADSPCWLNEPDRALYEQTVDMAKDLLELVMEGPELEDVWRAFQPDNEPIEIDDDDEEREARLLHPEDDN